MFNFLTGAFAQSNVTSDSKFTVVYNAQTAKIYIGIKEGNKWHFSQFNDRNGRRNCTYKLEYSHNPTRFLENSQIVLHDVWCWFNNVFAYSFETLYVTAFRSPLVRKFNIVYIWKIVVINLERTENAQTKERKKKLFEIDQIRIWKKIIVNPK